ncbi:RHS repeat-associated core domain-containing protein [Pseudomonas sp. NPDC086566]|uniref:RHS repeat-associated core domain-containing protein n=1 Tax=Pseudomonas sp. NPDC086566 TaxID=3390647 RepID=UPI003CFFECCA
MFYHLDKLSVVGGSDQGRRLIRHRNTLLAESHSGIWGGCALILTDAHGSVLRAAAATVYTPYGFDDFSLGISTLGFNGEMRDIRTGCYLLGRGARLFSPILRRFCSADSFSPFGVGSFNAYAYCEGDPINFTDPEGEAKFKPSVGITHRLKAPTNIKFRLKRARERQVNAELPELLDQGSKVDQALTAPEVDTKINNAIQEGHQLLGMYGHGRRKGRPRRVTTNDIASAYGIQTLKEQGLPISLSAYLKEKYGVVDSNYYGELRNWVSKLNKFKSASDLPLAIASSIRSQP